MKKSILNSTFGILATLACVSQSIAAVTSPVCQTGSLAYVEGEINNNAIAFPGPFPLTSGIAELKIVTEGKSQSYKLTCALSGTPSTNGPHSYDHRIVCNDNEQSELSFNTSFVGTAPLDRKLERKLCRGSVLSYFQESSKPDDQEPTKGIFSGVTQGELQVDGCVNSGSDNPPDIQINMVVEGYVCLHVKD